MMKDVCLLVIGMSGTGKTTFVKKFQETTNQTVHCINLDPAVKVIPYKHFLDIRNTHQYKKIMKEYNLGPNGAIITALNLFSAQPEKIIDAMIQKSGQSKGRKIFLLDIPGQIQVFTWSASSLILCQAIATIMPVRIIYLLDSNRCENPNNLLSNLLFAQSINYRMKKFAFLLILNKSDSADSLKLAQWINDYELFIKALYDDPSYLATLSKSIVLHLSDFYQQLKVIRISAKTGFGFCEVEKYLNLQEKNDYI